MNPALSSGSKKFNPLIYTKQTATMYLEQDSEKDNDGQSMFQSVSQLRLPFDDPRKQEEPGADCEWATSNWFPSSSFAWCLGISRPTM